MKTKKFISRCVAGGIALMLLAGCSGEQHIISYESGEDDASVAGSPAIAVSDIHAAILLPSATADNACMTSAHADAFKAATAELGITSYTLYDASPDDAEKLTSDSNVIFGACYDYMNALDAAAKNNPDKLYACFGGYKYNSTNYTNYYTAIYEAQYLAGIAAGTNSVSGKVGMISEYSSEYPDSAAEINSFALGARAANSSAEIIVKTLGSRSDTSEAGDFTKELIDEGCDVISIQCDTTAPAEIAAENGAMFIGYGTDMAKIGNGLCLTSVVWNLKDYYKTALTCATNGTWSTDGNYYGSLADGAVALSDLSEGADPITQARIDSAAELIRGSLLEIFSNRKVMFDSEGKAVVSNGALTDNKSNIMISEDGSSYFIYNGNELSAIDPASVTSDKLASANMNYLVDGVTVLS